MRNIDKISLHCSDSDNSLHDNIRTIRDWHTLCPPKGNGWDDVGYHFFIRQNGTMEIGRPLSEAPAAVKGHNKSMIAICLSGKNCFTIAQYNTAAAICRNLMDIFNIKLNEIYPHHYFNPDKTCPNYDVENIKKLIPTNKVLS